MRIGRGEVVVIVGRAPMKLRRKSRADAESRAGGWLPRAVIAAEDQRFHDHPGYDLADVAVMLEFASPSHLANTAERVAGIRAASRHWS